MAERRSSVRPKVSVEVEYAYPAAIDQILEDEAMSKDVKRRGFRFVGSTICYAFMLATGMVNDHVVDCFRYPDCC